MCAEYRAHFSDTLYFIFKNHMCLIRRNLPVFNFQNIWDWLSSLLSHHTEDKQGSESGGGNKGEIAYTHHKGT
jgi:hypothetical protein